MSIDKERSQPMKQRLNILLACIALGISASTDSLAQMQVVSISPSFNQIAPNTQPAISVTFNQPLDSTSVTPISFAVYGERSGYKAGRFSYSIDRRSVSFASSTPYNPGERVRVMLTRSIRSQSGDTLRGFVWEFRIPVTHARRPYFRPLVRYPGFSETMQVVDMNNDGYADIVTAAGIILLNDGSGRFPASWVLPNAAYGQAVADDLNRDGYMDVVYPRGGGTINIGLGNGNGLFTIQTIPRWFYYYTTSDVNLDGFPDLVGINRIGNRPDGDTLSNWGIAFNNGSGNFTDTIYGGVLTGWFRKIITADIDNDGDVDVLIISHPAVTPGGIYGLDGFAVFKNSGQASFDTIDLYPANLWLDIGFPEYIYGSDFNNDGLTDVAIVGDFTGVVSLNLGNGVYGTDSSSIRHFHGAEAVAPFTGGDFNGDNWIDVTVSGFIFDQWTFMRTTLNCFGNFYGCGFPNVFEDTLDLWQLFALEAGDLDNDGDLDLVHGDTYRVYVSINVDSVVSVDERENMPQGFGVRQNYPNPFNPSTTMEYDVPQYSHVRIVVYDVLGREVDVLVNEAKHPGRYRLVWNSSALSSGVYFYRLTTAQGTITRKLVLIK